MVTLVYYKQPDEDCEEFVYGIKKIAESDIGCLVRTVYAGHNVRNLAEKIKELQKEGIIVELKNLARSDGTRLPLDKYELSDLEKILANGKMD